MKNKIPLFETRVSLKEFLNEGNKDFAEKLKGLDFKINFIREEHSEPWKFSLYTPDYSVPDNFKFYREKRNAYSSRFSPYDLSVSAESRRRDTERVMNGPKIIEFKFYFYKEKNISGKKCRIFLEDERIENNDYDVLWEKSGGSVSFPAKAKEIESFYLKKGMNENLIKKIISEINERRNLISKIDLFEE